MSAEELARPLRRLLAVAVAGMVLAAAGGIGALLAWRTAKAAERASAELAALAYLFDAANPSSNGVIQAANAAAGVAIAPDAAVPRSGLISHMSRLVPSVQLEHAGVVNSAVFSPDGARVVTASFDKTARVWDARLVDDANRKDLLDLAEVIVRGRIRALRDFVPGVVDGNRRLEIWRERAGAWANAPDGSFEQWVHWYFSDPARRPDQPGLWRSAAKP